MNAAPSSSVRSLSVVVSAPAPGGPGSRRGSKKRASLGAFTAYVVDDATGERLFSTSSRYRSRALERAKREAKALASSERAPTVLALSRAIRSAGFVVSGRSKSPGARRAFFDVSKLSTSRPNLLDVRNALDVAGFPTTLETERETETTTEDASGNVVVSRFVVGKLSARGFEVETLSPFRDGASLVLVVFARSRLGALEASGVDTDDLESADDV
jgi:hypothetical protein